MRTERVRISIGETEKFSMVFPLPHATQDHLTRFRSRQQIIENNREIILISRNKLMKIVQYCAFGTLSNTFIANNSDITKSYVLDDSDLFEDHEHLEFDFYFFELLKK